MKRNGDPLSLFAVNPVIWSSKRRLAQALPPSCQPTNSDIVFCDRVQRVGLTLSTGVATDTLTLELFQATKSANHFNFYAENTHGSAFMHDIEVQAKGNVECVDSSSNVTACPSTYQSGTKAAIGKRTVVIENVNNFGTY